MNYTTYAGLDVHLDMHKNSITVALARSGNRDVESIGVISNFEHYAYCLMDNHVHLLVKEKTEPVAVIVKRIRSSYVYWFNWKYERNGHLLQERFNIETVEDGAYFYCFKIYSSKSG